MNSREGLRELQIEVGLLENMISNACSRLLNMQSARETNEGCMFSFALIAFLETLKHLHCTLSTISFDAQLGYAFLRTR